MSMWSSMMNFSGDRASVARSVALGFFMAFSPFLLGTQVPLVFLINWCVPVHRALILGISYSVNNPLFSMIPIIIGEYMLGYALVGRLCGWDLSVYNPSILEGISERFEGYLAPYLGAFHFSLWYYVIGSLIVASCAACIAYAVMHFRYSAGYENHSAK